MKKKEQDDNTLWLWQELEVACGLATSGVNLGVNGISIDSRSVATGDLFIALAGDPGPRFKSSGSQGLDGHDYIESAEKNGATGLLISKLVDSGLPALIVKDTLDGLWQLGAAGRARMLGQVVAITGSSGKTTLRQWTQEILSAQASTHASIGSLNNHWGVPLSLTRMPRDTKFGVFEVGMNHPGEISPLASLVKPDIAVVLNVLPAHLGQFESLNHIRTEKLSIADGLSPEGVLIMPDDLAKEASEMRKTITFGFSQDADIRGQIIANASKSNDTRVEVTIDDSKYSYLLAGKGEHRVLTSLAAMAITHALGADLDAAAKTLSNITTPAGRGNRIQFEKTVLVDDSYNANPVSMAYAIEALKSSASPRTIAVLGEMFELGDSSVAAHLELQALCHGIDLVITVGEGFKVWQEGVLAPGIWQHYATASDIPLDVLIVNPEVEILIKGSNKVFWVEGFVEKLKFFLEGSNG
ncbi:MAG: UDP-N-acetylmuramoyl-tripeptide--D-alanyl-D-alanine ligase [Candidatus Azotimanducaceae bacterium]